MTINFKAPDIKELKPRILVLGVGGAGGNAINGMIDAGLQGVELVMLGYNTPSVNSQRPNEGPKMRTFHNRLVMQAGAYQNSTFVIGTAKAGIEDGHPLFGESCIIDPNGEILAIAKTEGDELVIAEINLDDCKFGKETIFDFGRHRRIEHYGLITRQTGIERPKGQ